MSERTSNEMNNQTTNYSLNSVMYFSKCFILTSSPVNINGDIHMLKLYEYSNILLKRVFITHFRLW